LSDPNIDPASLPSTSTTDGPTTFAPKEIGVASFPRKIAYGTLISWPCAVQVAKDKRAPIEESRLRASHVD